MVITGGELTIEMLDLKYNPVAKFCEAPLHIKALNGTFLIDDFGRQRAKPEDILNRWIVPQNSRVDYLTLHTGKSAMIPFDEIVIFSTNMHPDDLMDPAFQRRISYKLETVEPPEELFCEVFISMAKKNGLALTEDLYSRRTERYSPERRPTGVFPAQVHRRASPRVVQVRGYSAAVHPGERRRRSREPVRSEGR